MANQIRITNRKIIVFRKRTKYGIYYSFVYSIILYTVADIDNIFFYFSAFVLGILIGELIGDLIGSAITDDDQKDTDQ